MKRAHEMAGSTHAVVRCKSNQTFHSRMGLLEPLLRVLLALDGWNFTVHGTEQGAWDYERRVREIKHL